MAAGEKIINEGAGKKMKKGEGKKEKIVKKKTRGKMP